MTVRDLAKKWSPRVARFYGVGQVAFWINTAIVVTMTRLVPFLYVWFLTAIIGGIVELSLLTVINKRKMGRMFD